MPDSPMKDSEHQPLEAVEGIGIQLPSNGIQRSGHSRLPSEASSVDSIGSWSTETPSEAWDSSTSVDQSARNSVEPATPKIVNGDSSVEKAEKTEKIFELLSSTPADFILQEQEEPVTPTEKTMRKHLMPSSGPTEVHTRGRSTTTSNNEEARARPLQISRKPIQRTISSPPSIRRSKSVPRPLHIPPSASKQVINSTSSTRNKVVHDAGPERQSRSTAAPQHTKPTHLHLPPVNSQVPSGKPTPSLSTDEPPEHNAATTPLPQLPIQTYLHLALASPPLGPGVPLPSLNPAQPLETKYPYIPSDSPDLILERITNFIYLPPHLESVLWFGMLACLDSWLYTFTILPLRFLRAVGLLIGYWWSVLKTFWKGGRRLQKKRNNSAPDGATPTTPLLQPRKKEKERGKRVDRERKISGLLPQHKADLLKGAVVIVSCFVLTGFDASKMYHSIRGQAAIKLYVLYNVLEVGDRLCSALGQDIFECLFSKDTLERKPDGRSKVLRPFWCFLLATAYNILHSTCLFYQVVTLNVAVNSYSNALLTLLLSSQFVEIKSTVFKKFEKENLFQLTCADIVERFQLWLMLLIIISRNLVEVGIRASTDYFNSSSLGNAFQDTNATMQASSSGGMVLPRSFTMFPKWTGQVMGPFLLVLGSETLVDWLKHAYITKFNNVRPKVYERFLDVLCKDYYSNAFTDQNLTKRLGLPVIPLACLFIRASLQTYHMFISTHISIMTTPSTSTTTSISLDHSGVPHHASSPATTAAFSKFDSILRRALGRSSFGAGSGAGATPHSNSHDDGLNLAWADDLIAATTLIVFLLGVFLLFLALKLVLGILLLSFSRKRYKGMREREREDILTGGRRAGGFGLVEVDIEKRRYIYGDDPASEKRMREWEVKARDKEVEGVLGIGKEGGKRLDDVSRYSMVAKRIW